MNYNKKYIMKKNKKHKLLQIYIAFFLLNSTSSVNCLLFSDFELNLIDLNMRESR